MIKKFLLSCTFGIIALLFADHLTASLLTRPTSSKQFTYGIPVHLNSLGFREKEISAKHGKRIMVLGDSFTWGPGLHESERYTNLTEKATGIEVLNFGMHGGATTHEAIVLEKYIDRVNPDRIIVGFCWNDPWTNDSTFKAVQFKKEHSGLFSALDSSAFLFPGISTIARQSLLRYSIRDWGNDLAVAYKRDGWQWKAFAGALAKIKAISDAHRLPAPVFIILNAGVQPGVTYDYAHPDLELSIFLRYYHQAENEAQKAGFVTANVEAELTKKGAVDMSVQPFDAHPNAGLNKIYAEKLSAMLH